MFLLIISWQASSEPPATQTKVMFALLPLATASVQVWTRVASASKGMHQRAVPAAPACRRGGRWGAGGSGGCVSARLGQFVCHRWQQMHALASRQRAGKQAQMGTHGGGGGDWGRGGSWGGGGGRGSSSLLQGADAIVSLLGGGAKVLQEGERDGLQKNRKGRGRR